MKQTYFILLIILFSSCLSQEKTTQKQIEGVIASYCNATNEKNSELIPGLLFPDVFSEDMTKESVVEMFYKQLNATKKFEINNLKFEEPAILLEDTLNTKIYCQKYFSQITIGLDKNSPEQIFQLLKKEATDADPTAVIDEENYSLTYKDKKKIIVISKEGKFYLLPDAFFRNLNTDDFDANKVFEKYTTA